VLLLLMRMMQWRTRARPGEEAPIPGWMQKIDAMKPGAAVGLGLPLSVMNSKNLLLVVGTAVIVAQAELSTADEVVAVVVFTVLAASTVALPTLAYLFAGQRVQPALDSAKAWLSTHDAALMTVVLLVIGMSLFGKGLGLLL
jgi:hypothetical protein